MKRRRVPMLLIGLTFTGLGALAAAVAGPVSSAGAAGGYPPPSLVNTNCSFYEIIDVGTSYTLDVSCTYAPSTPVAVTFDGVAYESLVAPASGTLVETFTVTDPHISMNGGPSEATDYGDVNTFVASGLNSSGGTNVATTEVTTPTASHISGTTTTTASSGVTTSTVGTSGTSGGSIGSGSSGGSGSGSSNPSNPTGVVTAASSTTNPSSSGALAFTGADIAAAVVGGLALIILGTLLTMYARRRANGSEVAGPAT